MLPPLTARVCLFQVRLRREFWWACSGSRTFEGPLESITCLVFNVLVLLGVLVVLVYDTQMSPNSGPAPGVAESMPEIQANHWVVDKRFRSASSILRRLLLHR